MSSVQPYCVRRKALRRRRVYLEVRVSFGEASLASSFLDRCNRRVLTEEIGALDDVALY